MELTYKQTIALDKWEDNVTRQILFGGGAGGGKSAWGCYCILKSANKYPETRWVIGRETLKTLKETTLNSFFDVCRMQGLKNKQHYNYNQVTNIITLHNGSEIYLKDLAYYPSDPNFDELGSLEITGAFIDEVAQVTAKAKETIRTRIRYKLDDYGLIPKLAMSCNPSKNWTYSEFYKPSKEGTLPERLAFIQALVTDNRYISNAYIEELQSLKDRHLKERLLYGNWDYDVNPARLMEYDPCSNLFTNDHVPTGSKYITADIARFGQDRTVIIRWSGFRAEEITVIGSSTLTEAADIIKGIATKHSIPMSNVVCDEDGVGGGVVDILRCKGFVANKTSQKYANMKAECCYLLAEKVNNSQMFIADSTNMDGIIQELQAIEKANIDKDTKPSVNSKAQQKEILNRSPDYADALMMRMWFEANKQGVAFAMA